MDGELRAEGVTSFEGIFPENVQYEIDNIHPAPGKKYDGTHTGSLTGSIPYGNAKVTLAFSTVIDIGEEWQETNVFPEDVDLTGCDIEYKNHYTYFGRTSPGETWMLVREGIIQYEEDGSPIESDNPMETSETLKLIGHFYFHYCNDSPVASYEWKTTRPNRHIITMEDASANYTVEYYAMDGTRKAYRLKHKSGQWAGGYVTCKTNGSEIYYEGDVYQRYKAYQINEYTRESDWTDTVDPEASFVTYRLRLKNDYTVTFDSNGGVFDVQTLNEHAGEKINLPETIPHRMGYAFTCWSLTKDGTGEGWLPGGYIISEEDKTLIAQWRKLDSFVLPDDLLGIEENAFVSIQTEYVMIPDGCSFIGDYAFKDCDHLRQIRIPEDCMIGTDAFDGCSDVYIFSSFGSPAEWYCLEHSNCTFISENYPSE